MYVAETNKIKVTITPGLKRIIVCLFGLKIMIIKWKFSEHSVLLNLRQRLNKKMINRFEHYPDIFSTPSDVMVGDSKT